MKTLKLALAGTALAGALATSAVAADCSFSGFYLGAQLGAGTTNTQAKTAATAALGLAASNFTSNLAATGAIGGLHVGYGKQFPNRFYLGLEAYGNLSGNNQNNTDSYGIQVKTQRNNAFGLALRPGFVWGNALLYAKLGVESANFKYSVSSNGNNVAAGSLGSNSGRRTGFVPGLGVGFNANEHLILGVEATHTFYNSRTANLSLAGANAGSTKFQSQATDFTARASYKW